MFHVCGANGGPRSGLAKQGCLATVISNALESRVMHCRALHQPLIVPPPGGIKIGRVPGDARHRHPGRAAEPVKKRAEASSILTCQRPSSTGVYVGFERLQFVTIGAGLSLKKEFK